MFVRNGTNVPMPDCPRLKEVSKVFRVGMPKKEVEDTPTIIAVQQCYMTMTVRMGFRQIFGGSTPPKYFTEGVLSNISGVYSPQIISRNPIRQIFWGLCTPHIFDGRGSVKYLGGLHPPNI